MKKDTIKFESDDIFAVSYNQKYSAIPVYNLNILQLIWGVQDKESFYNISNKGREYEFSLISCN